MKILIGLTDIYESCVLNQVKDNSIEERLLPRALFFARALESLFEYDGKHSKVNEIKKKNSKNYSGCFISRIHQMIQSQIGSLKIKKSKKSI